ncbi:hypothetical protein IPL68_02580 [Candidatus Saccharibacteria bacterium]|nr:MAG: hypothetical protein IPL68_02580 [Candidatus Saccharibacteria bacterium]
MMLKNILRYYHENDLGKFYEVYFAEVETKILIKGGRIRPVLFGLSFKKNELTDIERQLIESEYSRFSNSDFDGFSVKESPEVDGPLLSKSKVGRIIWRVERA